MAFLNFLGNNEIVFKVPCGPFCLPFLFLTLLFYNLGYKMLVNNCQMPDLS